MRESIIQLSNPYYRCSKIGGHDFEVLLHQFCIGATTSDAAAASGVTIRSVKAIYKKIRQRVAKLQLDPVNGSGNTAPEKITSIGWNYFVASDQLTINANWGKYLSDICLSAEEPYQKNSALIIKYDNDLTSRTGESQRKIRAASLAIREVLKTQGIKIIGADGCISAQCWDHLVAATWLINHKGRSYQTLKTQLLTVPL